MSELSRGAKVMAFVLVELQELGYRFTYDGAGLCVTEQGARALLQWRESGFEPTDDEIRAALASLKEMRAIEPRSVH